MKRIHRATSLLLALALAWPPIPAGACGPYFPEAVFIRAGAPDNPMGPFVAGRLGILDSSFNEPFLYIAYRHLSGTPFGAEEQETVLSYWRPAQSVAGTPPPGKNAYGWPKQWSDYWEEAADKIPSVQERKRKRGTVGYGSYQQISRTFQYYENCHEDAFRNAYQTFERRSRAYGTADPYVQEWADAQDLVFENCSRQTANKSIPAPPKANWPAWLKADRHYQIAAAHFYAEDFDQAREIFDRIATDAESPWRELAPYLAARALIRKGTLEAGAGEVNRPALEAAGARLRAVLADPSRSPLHPASRRLLEFVRFRLDPEGRAGEAARNLMSRTALDSRRQDLIDFSRLLEPESPVREPLRTKLELADWILTFQEGWDGDHPHALDRWRQQKSTPWLVAALVKVPGDHPASQELLEAAKGIRPDSAAYATVHYHVARLLMEQRKVDEARAVLDELLTHSSQLPRSSLNLILARRMTLARDLDEFLRFAPRVPSRIAVTDDSDYWLENVTDLVRRDIEPEIPPKTALLDADAARILTEKMPLSVLLEVSQSSRLTERIRREVALATLTRAFLLRREDVETAVLPTIEALAPELKGYSSLSKKTANKAERRFAAALAFLRSPGVHPYIPGGLGRETAFTRIDNFRDNWWCSLSEPHEWNMANYYWKSSRLSRPLRSLYPNGESEFPSFLTPRQREAAQQEWQVLSVLEGAPNVLGKTVLDWAKKNPKDPRVPEALHLVVRATRYGCTDTESGKYSKEAFELLHRGYPNSNWARKTPYWYN